MNNKRQIKFLSKDEVYQIINSCEDTQRGRRDRALLSVLFSTGLRISEALALEKRDFEAVNPTKTLEKTVIGKGQKQRTVYFSKEALADIFNYAAQRVDDDPHLFPISVRRVEQLVKQRAKAAGVEKEVFPHVFRHSFACYLLGQGISIYHIQRFLGHSNLNTTTVYLNATNDELKKIHEEIYK